ncbi:MAG: hypothetical protein H6550_03455 [Chitinophagales bacterium]|nr:hypothetical protein [Chitinophagales bacterium]
MRYYFTCITFLLLTINCNANKQEKAVQQSFEALKQAFLKRDGQTALQYVSSSTIIFYNELINWALHADSIQVNSMTVMNKVSVLAIRAEKDLKMLKQTNGEQLFAEAVEKDKVDNIWFNQFTLDKITFEDSTALASVIYESEEIIFKFRFVFEQSSWHFDMLSFFKINEYLIRDEIKKSNNTENDYVLELLKDAYGDLSESDLWQPLE